LPGADFTACHGVFGLLDVLLDGARSGRDAHTGTIAAIVNYATEQFHRGERAWPSGLLTHEEICGLMLGNAGIGHVYLRLGDPSLGSLLAPRLRQAVADDSDNLPVPGFGEAGQASNATRP
jgi:lantibiotic modifying enzyme